MKVVAEWELGCFTQWTQGGICERNTVWRCVGLKWQPEAVVWVMENEVVATAQAKREKQLWTAGLRIHMQFLKKNVLARRDTIRTTTVD